MSLDRIRRGLEARALELAGLGARIRFDMGAEGTLLVDATARPVAVTGDGGEADCTIRVSAADLERMMAGALDPTAAYSQGRLKVEGSMGIAMKLAQLLES